MNIEEYYDENDLNLLSNCTLCPRECGADRLKGEKGYCESDAGPNIASICIHRGEEPPISGPRGICNIFFSGCNLRCSYCQNFEISRPEKVYRRNFLSFNEAFEIIVSILDRGIKAVGFVSPSHVVPQMRAIIKALNSKGYKPITIYNTNSYDKLETIRNLSDLIDVYLPDFKYANNETAWRLSDVHGYYEVALEAMKEMYYQKGSVLFTDEEGMAERGVLIRHLVLPGHAEESKLVLRTIANELSPGIYLSLMSQYHPTEYVRSHPLLKRGLYQSEYLEIVREMENLGFRNGWIQDLDSHENYLPDFSRENPFG